MTRAEVDGMARVLMAAWEEAEGKPVNVSYVATFADMARAALAALEGERYDTTMLAPVIPDMSPEERATREAAQEGERGGAEVAAVEGLLLRWAKNANATPPREAAVWELAREQLRAALGDHEAVAKHAAEVLRAAADDLEAGPASWRVRLIPWLRERADRIEAQP